MEPPTPDKIDPRNSPEVSRRRSLRLSAAVETAAVVSSRKRKSPLSGNLLKEGLPIMDLTAAISLIDAETVTIGDGEDKGILSLRSGKKVSKPIVEDDKYAVRLNDVEKASGVMNMKIEKDDMFDGIGHSNSFGSPENIGVKDLEKSSSSDKAGTIRKNKRKLSLVEKVKVEVVEIEDVLELDKSQRCEDTVSGIKTRRYWKEKEMEKVVGDGLLSDSDTISYISPVLDNLGPKISGKEPMTCDDVDVKSRRVLSRKDKGKDKVVEDDYLSNVADPLDLTLRLGVGNSNDEKEASAPINLAANASDHVIKEETAVAVNNAGPVLDAARGNVADPRGRVKERFRDIARKNASRFAHFSSQEPAENHVDNQPVAEATGVDADREEEDWPGPFSTAMKIIRDRKFNVPMAQQSCDSYKSKTGSIKWVPKKQKHPLCSVPKLQDLCMDILAKNAEAISSLESVPDVIRHKLSHILCDSRKMNAQFLGLLVCGSPTEIRIRDCSWLTEEEFSRAFQQCDTSLLTVLQLDQCGRCLPDYLLPDTLARSANALPILTALSIKGACRLSDAGLSALVVSAPVLRSINLSQCSLLTIDGINILANSLGSILKELYLDDCQGLDPMLMLPALLEFEQLEVLSLAGIQTVSDAFVKELVAVCGQNFKELVLTDCMKLTDSSLKAIAETCTGLHALDLSNLNRLTDSTLGNLANGCRKIKKLKLSRNAFSDEAVAAYLEASGESLKELSLNNVRKVADETAISLSRRSKKLLNLDLSWCRNLTNEALGLIVDSCLSLRILKLFGCTQITNDFVNGHSNPQLQVIGLKMTPILKNLCISEPQQGPLHYSAA